MISVWRYYAMRFFLVGIVDQCICNLTFAILFDFHFPYVLHTDLHCTVIIISSCIIQHSLAADWTCFTVHCMLIVYRECLVLLQCLTGWGVLLPDFFTSSLFAPVLGVLGCWVHKTNFISKTRITVKITLTQNKQKHLAVCLAFWLHPRYGLYLGKEVGETL